MTPLKDREEEYCVPCCPHLLYQYLGTAVHGYGLLINTEPATHRINVFTNNDHWMEYFTAHRLLEYRHELFL